MAQVIINAEQCKACMLCIEFCPRKCLALSDQLNSRGFHAAARVNMEACSGCGICALMCPDVCIEIRPDAEAVAR
ncbi:MAG TPA: ferredoxin family protein [Armatimonadota bacterium]|jgi:2-oxoglutarate ferredoxin oxidoreductase subunit delta